MALVPDSPMLVPGVTGRTDLAKSARAGAAGAVSTALGALGREGRVVAVGSGSLFDSGWRDPLEFVVSLGGLGVPDDALPDEIVAGGPDGELAQIVPVNLASACYLLEDAGWRGPVRYVLVPDDQVWSASLDLALNLTSGFDVSVLCAGAAPATGHGPWQVASALARLSTEWLPALDLHHVSGGKLAAATKTWGAALEWQGKLGELWSCAAAWTGR